MKMKNGGWAHCRRKERATARKGRHRYACLVIAVDGLTSARTGSRLRVRPRGSGRQSKHAALACLSFGRTLLNLLHHLVERSFLPRSSPPAMQCRCRRRAVAVCTTQNTCTYSIAPLRDHHASDNLPDHPAQICTDNDNRQGLLVRRDGPANLHRRDGLHSCSTIRQPRALADSQTRSLFGGQHVTRPNSNIRYCVICCTPSPLMAQTHLQYHRPYEMHRSRWPLQSLYYPRSESRSQSPARQSRLAHRTFLRVGPCRRIIDSSGLAGKQSTPLTAACGQDYPDSLSTDPSTRPRLRLLLRPSLSGLRKTWGLHGTGSFLGHSPSETESVRAPSSDLHISSRCNSSASFVGASNSACGIQCKIPGVCVACVRLRVCKVAWVVRYRRRLSIFFLQCTGFCSLGHSRLAVTDAFGMGRTRHDAMLGNQTMQMLAGR